MQECREPRTVVLSWMQAHRRGGKLLNPSQAGFHFIKRERSPIPFTPGKNSRSRHPSQNETETSRAAD